MFRIVLGRLVGLSSALRSCCHVAVVFTVRCCCSFWPQTAAQGWNCAFVPCICRASVFRWRTSLRTSAQCMFSGHVESTEASALTPASQTLLQSFTPVVLHLRAPQSGRRWPRRKCPLWWTTSSRPSSTPLRHQKVRKAHQKSASCSYFHSYCLNIVGFFKWDFISDTCSVPWLFFEVTRSFWSSPYSPKPYRLKHDGFSLF